MKPPAVAYSQYLCYLSPALCAGGLILGLTPGPVVAETVEFDQKLLQSRGLDDKVAAAFSEAPRFMAGPASVQLSVNGIDRGRVLATFGEAGELCVSTAFVQRAGLVAESGLLDREMCTAAAELWPQSEVAADPGLGRLSLVVPAQFLVSDVDPSTRVWSHGGVAALINYDAQYMASAGGGKHTEFTQINTEAGFNAADWVVRSRQQFSEMNGKDQIVSQGIWAQRTWAAARKVMQAGQISMNNAGQVLGIQFIPETALQRQDDGPALVEGIADEQSVVEVRQSQVLIYSTTVPAGPFSLQGFRMLNTRTDLQVKVTSLSGSVREFTVPASAFLHGGLTPPGLSFGVGRPDSAGAGSKPVLLTAAGGIGLGKSTLFSGSLLASSLYNQVELSLNTQTFRPWMLTVEGGITRDSSHDENGAQAGAEVSWVPVERLTLGASFRLQSAGYRELYDALQKSPLSAEGMSRQQTRISAGWDADSIGSLSLSLGRSSSYGGSSVDYVRGAWSRVFGSVQVSASIARNTMRDGSGAENLFYLTASLPIGSGRLTSYVNEGNGQTRTGMRWSDRFSQDRGYSLAADRDLRTGKNSGTVSGDMVTPLSQLSGSVSSGDARSTSWTARASGAVVAHADGITTSPYQIGDTLGIARVGNEQGVRVDTPGGPVWTDARGFTILPGLRGYRKSVVQLDTRSLRKNVDIMNAWLETETARGSVARVDFDVVRTRRILATIRHGGGFIPRGASIFDQDGTFITVSGEKGSVFIPDAAQISRYDVQVSGHSLCSFRLTLPERPTQGVLYETVDSVCNKEEQNR